MMLFKKSVGRIENRRRDAHSVLESGFDIKMKNNFLYYDFKNLDTFIKKYNWYATREVMDYIEYKNGVQKNNDAVNKEIQKNRNKKFAIYYKLLKFLRCRMRFIYTYFFCLFFGMVKKN